MEIYIDEKEKYDASAAANSFAQKDIRNRAYINTLGAELAIKYLLSENIDVSNLHNIHSIKKILEEIDVSDIILSNIHIDVRVVFDENAIFIPKSHFEYNLVPDIYLVFNLAEDFSHVKCLGFFEPKLINKNNANSEYYFIEKEKLSSPSDLVKYIKAHANNTEKSLSQEDIENSERIIMAMADNEISEKDKKYLISQLTKSSELRDKFIEFENFEILSAKAMVDSNIVKKYPTKESAVLDEFETFDALVEPDALTEDFSDISVEELPSPSEEISDSNVTASFLDENIDSMVETDSEEETSTEPELLSFDENVENLDVETIEDNNNELELLTFDENIETTQLDENFENTEPELLPFEGNIENIDIDGIHEDNKNNETELLPFMDNDINDTTSEIEENISMEAVALDDIELPELDMNTDSAELNNETGSYDSLPFENLEEPKENESNFEMEPLPFEGMSEEIALDDMAEISEEKIPSTEESFSDELFEDMIPNDEFAELDNSNSEFAYESEAFGKNLLENLSSDENIEVEEIPNNQEAEDLLSQIDNVIETSTEVPFDETQDTQIPSVDDLLNEDDKLNVLYNESENIPQNLEEQIETTPTMPGAAIYKNSSQKNNKKSLITAAALITVLAAASVFTFMKPKNNTESNIEPLTPNKEVANQPTENILESNVPVVNKPEQKDQTKPDVKELKNTTPKVASSEPYMTVNKLVWNVPDSLSYSTKMQNYLRTAGKSIKLSLSADLLLATEYAYTNQVKVDLKLNKDGSIQDATILSGSGSSQIDNIVLQSVKDTLNIVKPPSEEINTPNFNLNLIIYF